MRRIEIRLTDGESADLDLLCRLTNRRRADAARVAIAEWLRVLKQRNTKEAFDFIGQMLPTEQPRELPEIADAHWNTLAANRSPRPPLLEEGDPSVPRRVVEPVPERVVELNEEEGPRLARARKALAAAEKKAGVKPKQEKEPWE